jgi:hypothetical protein
LITDIPSEELAGSLSNDEEDVDIVGENMVRVKGFKVIES